MPFFYIPDSGSLAETVAVNQFADIPFGDNFQFAAHIQDIVLSSVELGILASTGNGTFIAPCKIILLISCIMLPYIFGGRPFAEHRLKTLLP